MNCLEEEAVSLDAGSLAPKSSPKDIIRPREKKSSTTKIRVKNSETAISRGGNSRCRRERRWPASRDRKKRGATAKKHLPGGKEKAAP